MKVTTKFVLATILLLGALSFAGIASAEEYVQTICFSKSSCTDKYAYGTLGEDVGLCGGQCQGKKMPQMNAEGWRLIQVVGGLDSAFGMVFEKKIKK